MGTSASVGVAFDASSMTTRSKLNVVQTCLRDAYASSRDHVGGDKQRLPKSRSYPEPLEPFCLKNLEGVQLCRMFSYGFEMWEDGVTQGCRRGIAQCRIAQS